MDVEGAECVRGAGTATGDLDVHVVNSDLFHYLSDLEDTFVRER